MKTYTQSKQPIVESAYGLSDDGKWFIHRTIITSITARDKIVKEIKLRKEVSK